MDHRPFFELWRGGYLSTYNRLKGLSHRISGDVKPHGFQLNLKVAEVVASQLEQKEIPELRDFFPEGEIKIKQPQLSLTD